MIFKKYSKHFEKNPKCDQEFEKHIDLAKFFGAKRSPLKFNDFQEIIKFGENPKWHPKFAPMDDSLCETPKRHSSETEATSG